MIVKDILSAKGSDVVTISPKATVAEAVKIMAERHIGALVITGPDDRIIGIVSERDVVRALAARGNEALSLSLTEVMTRKVITCSRNEMVAAIMEQMTHGKFRHVPVVEEARLVGIVSIGDVVKLRLAEMEHEHMALQDYIRTA